MKERAIGQDLVRSDLLMHKSLAVVYGQQRVRRRNETMATRVLYAPRFSSLDSPGFDNITAIYFQVLYIFFSFKE